jgi:hypothetical protein
MQRITSYFVLRRRLAKSWLKLIGWRFRGQDQPSRWNLIMLVSPAQGEILKMQHQWMTYLTSNPSKWVELEDIEEIARTLNTKKTVLIKWDENINVEALYEVLLHARNNKVRISACAWDTTHKAIKFHSQFRPSPYPERDLRYISRFFVYFKKV